MDIIARKESTRPYKLGGRVINMAPDNNTIDAFFCPSKILPDNIPGSKRKPGRSKGRKVSDLAFFDWLAPNFDKLQPILDPTRFQAHSVLLDILNVIKPSPKNVLDLGCGTGMLTSQILELFPDAHVYAIDGSIKMLEAARANLDEFSGQITLAKADFRDPWDQIFEEPLDVIIHYSALHHLPHDAVREVYTRLAKVLRPGGWFLHGDILLEHLPEPVKEIANRIARLQKESALMDIKGGEELLNEFYRIKDEKIENGEISEEPVLPEQTIAWLMEAGFEFASRVYQDWQVSLFLARTPEK